MIKKTKADLQPQESVMSLSKYVALSGVCSRRKATEMIENGQVTVNGEVIPEPGFRVSPLMVVKAQGRILRPEEKVYILLNKPKDYITTLFDERGRKTVMDLVQLPEEVRLYPVGRLDRATTGLLVLTNDGEFAQKLSHPRYEISKTYHVTLDKPFSQGNLKRIGLEGVELEDGHVDVDAIGYVPEARKNEIVIELHSGKNRIVRRIFESFGFTVKKLDRISYAGLSKQGLRTGQWRKLTGHEISTLKKTRAVKKLRAKGS